MNTTSKTIITLLSLATVAAIFAGLYFHVFRKGAVSAGKIVEETVTFEGTVENLSLDLDLADVTISTGKTGSVQYTLPENMVPDIDFQNGTLKIMSPKKNTFLWPVNLQGEYKVAVTLPEESSLVSAVIETDAGNLTVNDLQSDRLELKVDAGNVIVNGVQSNRMDVNADAGNVTVNGVQSERLFLKADAGNIELTGTNASKADIEVDAGNIKLSDCMVDEINAAADAGNIEAVDSTIKEGSCETDLGNISLAGEIGDVQTKTSLGKASVE